MIEVIINYIDEISKGNPMIAGAITLTVTGLMGWCLTRLPKLVLNFIKSQFITTLSFTNTDWSKKVTFDKITSFLHQLTTESGSRSLSLDSYWVNDKDVMSLTMGWGNHFFIYKNRLLWLKRDKLESSGSETLKEEITISYLGRSHELFHSLMDDNKPHVDETLLNFSEYKDKWEVRCKVKKQSLTKLALNPDTRDIFTKEIQHFKDNKVTYDEVGIPYKLNFVLHGASGSGKSSVIRSIASDYNMNLCNLPLNGMTDKSLRDALMSVPKNSIVVIEDFDSCSAVDKRDNVTGISNTSNKAQESKDYSFLTLSGVLNALDGIASLSDIIIMLTTNCLDNIDTALLREGRVDRIIELPKISGNVVKEHLECLYKLNIDKDIRDLYAKDINAIKFRAKGDSVQLLEILDKHYRVEG